MARDSPTAHISDKVTKSELQDRLYADFSGVNRKGQKKSLQIRLTLAELGLRQVNKAMETKLVTMFGLGKDGTAALCRQRGLDGAGTLPENRCALLLEMAEQGYLQDQEKAAADDSRERMGKEPIVEAKRPEKKVQVKASASSSEDSSSEEVIAKKNSRTASKKPKKKVVIKTSAPSSEDSSSEEVVVKNRRKGSKKLKKKAMIVTDSSSSEESSAEGVAFKPLKKLKKKAQPGKKPMRVMGESASDSEDKKKSVANGIEMELDALRLKGGKRNA